MKPDDESSAFHLRRRDKKWMRSSQECLAAHLVHCGHFASPCCPAPLSQSPQRGYVAPQSPRQGVTYETLHPRRPHVPDHSARLAKQPLLCSHYPFNVSLRGVSFLLLTLIQVQSIITPRGIG